MWVKPTENPELTGYSNGDWDGSVDDIKSTSRDVYSLGNGVFSWLSQKQDTSAQSTIEAKYIASCASVNEAIWLRRILSGLGETKTSTKIC